MHDRHLFLTNRGAHVFYDTLFYPDGQPSPADHKLSEAFPRNNSGGSEDENSDSDRGETKQTKKDKMKKKIKSIKSLKKEPNRNNDDNGGLNDSDQGNASHGSDSGPAASGEAKDINVGKWASAIALLKRGLLTERQTRHLEAELEFSIASLEEALTVFSRHSNPAYWANTLQNLGLAYFWRIRGSASRNAQVCVEALTLRLAADEALFTREHVASSLWWCALANWRVLQGPREWQLQQAESCFMLHHGLCSNFRCQQRHGEQLFAVQHEAALIRNNSARRFRNSGRVHIVTPLSCSTWF